MQCLTYSVVQGLDGILACFCGRAGGTQVLFSLDDLSDRCGDIVDG